MKRVSALSFFPAPLFFFSPFPSSFPPSSSCTSRSRFFLPLRGERALSLTHSLPRLSVDRLTFCMPPETIGARLARDEFARDSARGCSCSCREEAHLMSVVRRARGSGVLMNERLGRFGCRKCRRLAAVELISRVTRQRRVDRVDRTFREKESRETVVLYLIAQFPSRVMHPTVFHL